MPDVYIENISLADAFNIVAYSKSVKLNESYLGRFGLASGSRAALAFTLALETERNRLRRDNGLVPLTVRSLDANGTLRENYLNDDTAEHPRGAGLSPEHIMSLRPAVEHDYQAKMIATFKSNAACAAPLDEDILKTRPSDDAVVEISKFKAWRTARAAHIARMKNPPAAAPIYDAHAFREQLEATVETLAFEKMEQRMKLVDFIRLHGPELFSGNDRLIDDAICQVLLKKPDAIGRNSTAGQNIPHTAEQIFGNPFARGKKARTLALIGEYDRFVNDLFFRSGIALLSNAEKENVLAACDKHLSVETIHSAGFRHSLKLAAAHTRNMIMTDLFCPSEIKQKHIQPSASDSAPMTLSAS